MQLFGGSQHRKLCLGVRVWPITPELASLYRLPVKAGLLVEEVVPGSGAAKAGLKVGTHTVTVAGTTYTIGGDIIVSIDGQNIGGSYAKFWTVISTHKPGDKIALGIYRGNKKMTVSVTLGNR